jgi:arylsulfatase A-like enzyme
MKNISTIALLSLSVAGQSQATGEKAAQSVSPPNVIFFALDDLNEWINPLGYDQAITPNLNRLAKAGVTFTNAHAPSTYCAPSRTAIFTGLQASTTGCYGNEIYHFDFPDLVPLQVAFKEGGYNTWGAGKLFHHRGGYVDLRGWNEYFARTQEIIDSGYEMGAFGSDYLFPDPCPYSPYYRETGKEITGGAFLEWGPIPDSLEDSMKATIRTNWVVDLLRQTHEKPFFIGLGLYHPHYPNYVPQKYFDMYDLEHIQLPNHDPAHMDDLPPNIRNQMLNRRRNHLEVLLDHGIYKDAVRAYLAAVTYADAMLGRVLDALEESDYGDNTIVIVWSDQGYHLGEKGQWGKHTLWRETSRVPFIVSGADLAKDKKVGTTVGLIDLYPTLAELCNLPQQHQLDGVSLASILKNPETAEDRDLFIPGHIRERYAVVNSNYRYIKYEKNIGEEFYDLKKDPYEWNNLAGEQSYESIIEEMKKAVPTTFSPEATPRNDLKLIIEGKGFRWERKNVSVPKLNNSKSLNVYPVPANDILHIDYYKRVDKFKIVNIFGKVVMEEKNHENLVNISGLQSGLYFIQVNDEVTRFIK